LLSCVRLKFSGTTRHTGGHSRHLGSWCSLTILAPSNFPVSLNLPTASFFRMGGAQSDSLKEQIQRKYNFLHDSGLSDDEIAERLLLEYPSLKDAFVENQSKNIPLRSMLGMPPETRARIIRSVDFDKKVFYLETKPLSYSIWAFSHRWELRVECETWTVKCDQEEYTCLMFRHEVENISNYLAMPDCEGLWLDYICINQNDEQDKCAQVGIMGTLYKNVTSLIVGKGLAPIMPSVDYTNRAWCFQERMFGYVKFPQNFDAEDAGHVSKFANAMIQRLPGLSECQKYTLYNCGYDSGEDWRVSALLKQAESNPMYSKCKDLLEKMAQSIRSNDHKATISLSLRVREKVFADLNIDPKEWTKLMCSCAASYQHDRLYGLWGVLMNARGVSMPYDNPNKALNMLHLQFPQSSFAYPPSKLLDEVSYKESALLDVDQGIATVHELTMTLFEVPCHEQYKRPQQQQQQQQQQGESSLLLVDETVGNEVWGLQWGGNDVKFRIVADAQSIGIAYDDPPESSENKTLRLVFGLGFWQAYRDHKDIMPKGDPLGNIFETAFYRRAWYNDALHEHPIWYNNREFWGLGDNDWRWKFHILDYILSKWILSPESPLNAPLDKFKQLHELNGVNVSALK